MDTYNLNVEEWQRSGFGTRPKREKYDPRKPPPPGLPNIAQLEKDFNIFPSGFKNDMANLSAVERRYESILAEHVRVIWENDTVKNGLQCKKNIKTGSYLGRYYGKISDYNESRSSVYDVVLSTKTMLLVDEPSRYAHYANNCTLKKSGHCNAQIRQIGDFKFLFSIRDIKENQFVHWCYLKDKQFKDMKCACNTKQLSENGNDLLTMERKMEKGGVYGEEVEEELVFESFDQTAQKVDEDEAALLEGSSTNTTKSTNSPSMSTSNSPNACKEQSESHQLLLSEEDIDVKASDDEAKEGEIIIKAASEHEILSTKEVSPEAQLYAIQSPKEIKRQRLSGQKEENGTPEHQQDQ